jgi:hypothetical protein
MKLPSVLLLLTLACGCFYHSAQIELTPSSDAPVELTSSEAARATEIVARVVSERGLVADSRSPEIERLSREEDEWKDYILAVYVAGSEAETDNRVVVSVLVNKETGRYSVLVRDLDSPASTGFTDSLERSLTEALSAAFPSRNARVERETVGPALGP